MTQETNNLAADLWALADLLRGDFRQSQYGRVILPFALLRRLECVLESSKSAVLVEAAKVEKMAIAEEAKEKLLLRATGGLSFFNTSPMDLSTLGESGIKANLERYIQFLTTSSSPNSLACSTMPTCSTRWFKKSAPWTFTPRPCPTTRWAWCLKS